MNTTYYNLLGTIAGVTIAFLMPSQSSTSQFMESIANIILGVGRYLFLPLVFFSLPVAVTKLRRLGSLRRLLSLSALYVLLSSALLSIIGTAIASTTVIDRIPLVSVPLPSQVETVRFGEIIRSIISFEGFRNPTQEGIILLSLLFPAFLLGWNFFHDKEIAEPSYNFFDSLSRIFYRMNSGILVLMPFFLAILSFHTVYNFRLVVDFQRFIPLLAVFSGISFILIVGVYPLLLWKLGQYKSPWHTFGCLFGAFIGAFVSASSMFNYGNLTLHLKEKLKIYRQTSALIAPAFLMFARGGTALVVAICMMTVIRSYSSLEITLFQAAWIALFSFLISFTLPTVPVYGVVTALMLIGNLYARGLENGWHILAPIIPLLIMFSTLLDTATGAVLLILANKHSGLDIREDYSESS